MYYTDKAINYTPSIELSSIDLPSDPRGKFKLDFVIPSGPVLVNDQLLSEAIDEIRNENQRMQAQVLVDLETFLNSFSFTNAVPTVEEGLDHGICLELRNSQKDTIILSFEGNRKISYSMITQSGNSYGVESLESPVLSSNFKKLISYFSYSDQ